MLSQTGNKIESFNKTKIKGGGEKEGEKRNPHDLPISSHTSCSMSLCWELACVSMCHSKSAQLSHPGWGEHENKGPEQKGQPWGRGEPHQATKEARKHCGQAGVRPPGREGWQGAEASWETAHRGEQEAPWPKEEQLQNDDPLKEP